MVFQPINKPLSGTRFLVHLFMHPPTLFDLSSWNNKVVNKGQIFRHLDAPLGVDISDKQRFEWI